MKYKLILSNESGSRKTTILLEDTEILKKPEALRLALERMMETVRGKNEDN